MRYHIKNKYQLKEPMKLIFPKLLKDFLNFFSLLNILIRFIKFKC